MKVTYILLIILVLLVGCNNQDNNFNETNVTEQESIGLDSVIKEKSQEYNLNLSREEYELKNKLDMLDFLEKDSKDNCSDLDYYTSECESYIELVNIVKERDCSKYNTTMKVICENIINRTKNTCDKIKDEGSRKGCYYFGPRIIKVYESKNKSLCEITEKEKEIGIKIDTPRAVCFKITEI